MKTTVSIKPRKLARSVARHEVNRIHATQFNKRKFAVDASNRKKSNFALNWRDLAIRYIP